MNATAIENKIEFKNNLDHESIEKEITSYRVRPFSLSPKGKKFFYSEKILTHEELIRFVSFVKKYDITVEILEMM